MTQQSQAITQKSASNLAFAFFVLPKPKRHAMSALYAFCREVDDVADDEAVPADRRRLQLNRWREDVRLACDGKNPDFIVNRELQPIIHQYKLDFDLLSDLIRGCEMDLEIKRYPDFPSLEQYCYRVASVVGLLSIQFYFGYTDPRCRDYAIYLGKALQLTNILRDVRTDAERGRIYLPQDELQLRGVPEDEILRFQYSDRFAHVAATMDTEARRFYALAHQTLPAADRRNMIAAEGMGSVYWKLLRKLEHQRFNVFTDRPTRLSKLHKAALILSAWRKLAFNVPSPNYGVA